MYHLDNMWSHPSFVGAEVAVARCTPFGHHRNCLNGTAFHARLIGSLGLEEKKKKEAIMFDLQASAVSMAVNNTGHWL